MVRIVQKKIQCFDKLRLGEGSGGKVDRVTRKDGKHYVLKRVNDGQDGMTEVSRHIMLEGAPHGSQLLMASIVVDPRLEVSLLFPYQGPFVVDLVEFVDSRGPLAPSLVRHVSRQLVEFVNWTIEKANIYHEDIRPENILIDVRTCKITVIDYGMFASYHNSGPFYLTFQGVARSHVPKKSIMDMDSFLCIPPEAYKTGWTTDDDYLNFMMGALYTYLSLGQRPFETQEAQLNHRTDATKWDMYDPFHRFLWDSISEDTTRRPHWRHPERHPFFFDLQENHCLPPPPLNFPTQRMQREPAPQQPVQQQPEERVLAYEYY